MAAKYTICVDFDGTIVKHDYPDIKEEVAGSIDTLKELVMRGHHIILYTMRAGDTLEAAVNWLNERGVILYGINNNPTQKSWSKSPKVYGHIYIDDAALGCPLMGGVTGTNIRPWVDWTGVRELLKQRGAL